MPRGPRPYTEITELEYDGKEIQVIAACCLSRLLALEAWKSEVKTMDHQSVWWANIVTVVLDELIERLKKRDSGDWAREKLCLTVELKHVQGESTIT